MKLLEWHLTADTKCHTRSYAMDYDLQIKFVIYNLESSSILKIFHFPQNKRCIQWEPKDRQMAHIEFNTKSTEKEMKEFAEIFRELLRVFKKSKTTLYTSKQELMRIEEILLNMDMGGVVI